MGLYIKLSTYVGDISCTYNLAKMYLWTIKCECGLILC